MGGFLHYFEALAYPFKWFRNKWAKGQNVIGGARVDVGRVKSYRAQVKMRAGEAKQMAKNAKIKVAAAGSSSPPGGNHGIVVAGALWWKKHRCANCSQALDKTWDCCPYCAQGAPMAPVTQAIMVDAAGASNGMQLCGWLVPIQGPQRGELFTLASVTSVGTDPTCTVVLHDPYMSSVHCEIVAEGGSWVLRDLKSTNGTYVNDKRVEQYELVDNDFVRLGQLALKFKSL